ncbi:MULTISPECIES: hypothetical protein [unclassified Duganella]|uniref:hypothetical protein n=1 Tax=unclassified Duganella TaxID=2636909 RepID=UPI0006F7EC4A|nr:MULTISPECIES: hypothetical protein [unclassified Duganella]KQV59873.1 hypothetical protein ASD07_24005 [Duganella sp. Root336D2]KRB87351.1 hypothetical protein ASE26_08210 [Duganella sp. Root198D2]
MKNSQLDPLGPIWTGTATAIAALYGLWPAMDWLRGPGQQGEKWFVLMFLGPIMFFVVTLPATAILCIIYKRIEEAGRYVASLVLVSLFLVFAGVPGLLGLSVIAVTFLLAWSTARKDQRIAQERDDFESEGEPREVEISPDFLASFPDPLWSRFDLDGCKALWAIEGEQDGAPYMIVEISHDQFGLMASEHSTSTTTFFLATIPAWISGRQVTWRPPGYHAWADKKYVYLAMPCKQAMPSSWKATLASAFRTAGSLQQASAEAGRPRAGSRPYRAVGGGFAVQALRCAMLLVFASFLLWGGLAPILGLVEFSAESVKVVPVAFLGSLFCFGGAGYFGLRARTCWLHASG